MGRQELSNESVTIEQKPPIDDIDKYDGDVVLVERIEEQDQLAALAFNEEPVTIRLQPSPEKNAAMVFPIWVNGKPAEVFQRGRWEEIGYLPVAQVLVVKRKVLEVIIRAKVDTVSTAIMNPESERPDNRTNRFTSPVHSFTIIEDRNPRGSAWASELMRRNF